VSARDGAYKALRELYVSHQGASAPWDKGCSHCDERMQKVMVVLDAFANTYAHELAEKVMALRANVPSYAASAAWKRGYEAALTMAVLEIENPQKEGQ
jgi:hypothetical protein